MTTKRKPVDAIRRRSANRKNADSRQRRDLRLKKECEVLQSQLDKLQVEQDQYLRSLHVLTRPDLGAKKPSGTRADSLRKRREELDRELTRLQAQRDACRKAVGALMWEDIEFDEDEALANPGQRPTIEDFIAELRKEAS